MRNKLFEVENLNKLFTYKKERIQEKILSFDRDYLVNVDKEELANVLYSEYSIDPVVIHWTEMKISDGEEEISGSDFPFNISGDKTKKYIKHVVFYDVPFTGDFQVARLHPIKSSDRLQNVEIVQEEDDDPTFSYKYSIRFRVIDWDYKTAEVKKSTQKIISQIKLLEEESLFEVKEGNREINEYIAISLQKRIEEFINQLRVIKGLHIPIKPKENIPETFALPITRKKRILDLPEKKEIEFSIDPTLHENTYKEIIRISNDLGKEMERHPSIYIDKNEEAIRDLFLMFLSPHFENVTGETFNHSGKADILIRYKGENAFISECKFWRGKKDYFSTINQILSYLTWRDSKAAIFIFNKNTKFNHVLDVIKSETSKHPNWNSTLDTSADGVYQYKFTLLGDDSRTIKLAVLCFNFPK